MIDLSAKPQSNSVVDAAISPSSAGHAARGSDWLSPRRSFEVPCTIEIERTRETLYAHVSLDGILVDEGDEVTVHDAPSRVAFGDHVTCNSHATVVKASALGRFLTRLRGYFELTELYEVGFQPKEG